MRRCSRTSATRCDSTRSRRGFRSGSISPALRREGAGARHRRSGTSHAGQPREGSSGSVSCDARAARRPVSGEKPESGGELTSARDALALYVRTACPSAGENWRESRLQDWRLGLDNIVLDADEPEVRLSVSRMMRTGRFASLFPWNIIGSREKSCSIAAVSGARFRVRESRLCESPGESCNFLNDSPETRRAAKSRRMSGYDLAGPTGLEPATSGVTGRRSNQLNYDPAS
jgi:hypothetical protein